MNNEPPLREPAGATWSNGWANWFNQVWRGLGGWKRTFTVDTTVNFGVIAASSESTTTATITGVRSGDSVIITPSAHVPGLIFTGMVTASNTVTLYAANFTGFGVDPPSITYRIIVFQN